MTKEEAKQVFLSRGYVEVEGGSIYDPDKWREACVVISEWLEQGSSRDIEEIEEVIESGDYISRQDAINSNCYNCSIKTNGGKCSKCDAVKAIEKLPSVFRSEWLNQESKTVLYSGDGYADGHMVYDMAECPNCGYEYEDGDKDWGLSFCPNCGQKLNWESEDK